MNTLAQSIKKSKTMPSSSMLAQRKCACAGASKLAGQCSKCENEKLVEGNKSSIQAKLNIGPSNDKYEQEADRMADEVMSMPEPMLQHQLKSGEEKGVVQRKPIASEITPLVQRQEPDSNTKSNPDTKAKSNEEKTKEALKKTAEAFLKTEPGKAIVKNGKEVVKNLPGTVITGTAAVGAITTLIATNKKLPIQAPAIPLDILHPGLSMNITVEGPLRAPTKAMISFSGKFGLPQRQTRREPVKTESEKQREENARMQREQFEFRESLKTPEEKARDNQLMVDQLSKRMVIPGLKLQEDVSSVEKKKEDTAVQRKATSNSAEVGTDTSVVDEVVRSPGQPLDTTTRGFMEQRFGYDFSQVRIHADDRAASSAQFLNARAYTVGQDIVFGSAQYSPSTHAGKLLLAHELTHTVQQSQSASRFRDPTVQRKGPKIDEKDKETDLRKSAWNPFFVHHDFKSGTEKERDIILEAMANENGREFAKSFEEFALSPDSSPHQIIQNDKNGPTSFWSHEAIEERGFILKRNLAGARGTRWEHWVHPKSTYLIFNRFEPGPKKGVHKPPKPLTCVDPSADLESIFGASLGCVETDAGPPDSESVGLACLYENRAIEFSDFESETTTYFVIDNSQFDGFFYKELAECGQEDQLGFEIGLFGTDNAADIFPSLNDDENETKEN